MNKQEISQDEWNIIQEKIINPMYEDGYFPLTLADKVTAILYEQKKQSREQWIEKASDNTDYVIAYADGLFCVTDSNGNVVCEFVHDVEQQKPLTIGDKIRESNESISAFIRGQFGDDRVFHNGSTIDLDDFLNLPFNQPTTDN